MAKWEQIHPAILKTARECAVSGHWPLYLFGHTGGGKTFAAALIYSRWKQTAAWWTLTELCDFVRGYNTANTQMVKRADGSEVSLSLTKFWAWVANLGLVVIDELGTKQSTDQRYDTFLRLLDSRTGRPLILTGNLDIEVGVPRAYDERIQSRILAGTILHCKSQDKRLAGFKQRLRTAE